MPTATTSSPRPSHGRRPTQARAIARRDALLDAAAELLARDGAAGLRFTEVAATAGVPAASLYQYFPTRQALLVGLAERLLGRIGERLRADVDAATGRRAALAALDTHLRAYVEAGLDGSTRELMAAMQADGELRALDRADTVANAAWLAERLAPVLRADVRTLARRLALVIELAGALAIRIADVDRRDRPATLDDFAAMAGALVRG